jgi:hypothetical protein
VTQCVSPKLVVPDLIGKTKSTALTAWTGAGFSAGSLTLWTGHTTAPVANQNVQAFSCVDATATMTASR